MEISWFTIITFFLVFAPAIMVVLTFRFFYPKARFVQINNFYLILPMAMASVFVNVDQLLDIAIYSLNVRLKIDSTDNNISNYIQFLQTLTPYENWPWTWLKSITNFISSGDDILTKVLKLHLRPVLATIGFRAVHRLLEWISDKLEYWKISKENKNRIKRSEDTSNWLSKKLSNFSDLISHPWVRHTRHNSKVEILMVDVLAEDNNLYSGRLNDFIPKENEVSSISLLNIFRYYPDEDLVKKAEDIENNRDLKKSYRKQRLVRNSGELILPYEKIKTVHIWNLKIGTSLRINVFDSNSEEQFKWYLALLNDCPHIFEKLDVYLFHSGDELVEFQKRVGSWCRDSDVSIDNTKVEIFLEESLQTEEIVNQE